MDDYEYKLLNMTQQEMEEIANGDDQTDENEEADTILRPGSKPDNS
jgi:hypothetical protein